MHDSEYECTSTAHACSTSPHPPVQAVTTLADSTGSQDDQILRQYVVVLQPKVKVGSYSVRADQSCVSKK